MARYEQLRALVRASFSETTQRLVDDALAYAECDEYHHNVDGKCGNGVYSAYGNNNRP